MFERLPAELLSEFKRRGVAVEVSNTLNAASLYNLLCSERDGVGVMLFAAALKKPRYVFKVGSQKPTTAAEVMEKRRLQLAKGFENRKPAWIKGK